MAKELVTYNTITKPAQGLFKDRGSKFYGYAYPFADNAELKEIIATLKKEHHTARHFCYGYRVNPAQIQERANDDGEPGHSAGTPILGQIQSKQLINVLVVVVRYFGGTKLGVPGLINAYKAAARDALEQAPVVTKELKAKLAVQFPYAEMNNVMRVIKRQQPEIVSQVMEMDVNMILSIRKDRITALTEELSLLKSLNFISE